MNLFHKPFVTKNLERQQFVTSFYIGTTVRFVCRAPISLFMILSARVTWNCRHALLLSPVRRLRVVCSPPFVIILSAFCSSSSCSSATFFFTTGCYARKFLLYRNCLNIDPCIDMALNWPRIWRMHLSKFNGCLWAKNVRYQQPYVFSQMTLFYAMRKMHVSDTYQYFEHRILQSYKRTFVDQ